ncbi:molybdopterin molybdotransferase MoeA [Aurantiacibacter poecillastricola]|uniref:molybdopterin molybdotransferase MoeA n=1 Tax=Aurantiacibacter poecillastricola TaxID=3064385 RepID=UPI00273FA501|nr:molybdopterin molybdotransferase MoeA [Aurantiacibacter sp. 219JJ12-13]MDP5262102.1 molybdopterin molybdotransferase MoeA [Aurantiacibacter sp. 219JJ12-13]
MSSSKPIPLKEAQRRFRDLVKPLETQTVPVEQAVGRYLAVPLVANRTQPAADLSAMDGYAMREDDLAGPWRIVGESAAGHPFAGSLAPGEAVRISTGAFMPADAGAVLMQENATREGDKLKLAEADGPTARHIRRAGFDFAAEDSLLPQGIRVDPPQVALAIAAGHAQLRVHARPTIAILDSGDELAADPTAFALHQIPASNGAMLAAMAGPFAAKVQRLGPVRDEMDAMLAALHEAGDADVIVTSGGASVGDHDLVRPALAKWGATIDFWKIAIKPGKPLLLARKGSQIILGLPGNPVSSYVTAYLFLLPMLRRLSGAHAADPEPVTATLAEALPAIGDRDEFVRARLEMGRAVPLSQQDSSGLSALAKAQVLIHRPAGAGAASAGDLVRAFPLRNGGIA